MSYRSNLLKLGAALSIFGASLPAALAQTTYITADRTTANGNPLNGAFSSIIIGRDASGAAFRGVQADITGGSVTNFVQARNGSTVSVFSGSVNDITVYDDSIVNLRGGTISAPSSAFSNYSVAGFGVSIINLYGGTITGNAAEVSEFATLNVYGSGLSAQQFRTGQQGNYSGAFYRLNGNLSDGTALQDFTIFDANDNSSNPGLNFNLFNVPEPSSLALLMFSPLFLGAAVARHGKK